MLTLARSLRSLPPSAARRCQTVRFSSEPEKNAETEVMPAVPLSAEEFQTLGEILYSPSPVNLEGSMTKLLREKAEKFAPKDWKFHSFKSNAGLVVDSKPQGGAFSAMVMGHADKIRMQVRHIASDGKIYVDSQSHLPLTLLGNQVTVFSLKNRSQVKGGTLEALGAIHFAEAPMRTGTQGIKPSDIYLELQLYGEHKDRVAKINELGIRVGDPILMRRKIAPGIGEHSFTGSHLDNGIGCYVAHALSKLEAEEQGKLRKLFAYSTHEEIGRFGSRQIIKKFKPDVFVAVDVNHDFEAAPNVGGKRFPALKMGGGPTLGVGAVCSQHVNDVFIKTAEELGIPLQLDVNGSDTGTDAMAGVLSSEDIPTVTIGIPVRNMHTVSECGVTSDITYAVKLIHESLKKFQDPSLQQFEHLDLASFST